MPDTYPARIYRPRHQRQRTLYNGKLIGCTETSFAMGVDATTFGGCRVTESICRKLSGEWPPDPNSPGLNIPQLVTIARKLHVPFVDASGGDKDAVKAALDANQRIVAQIWYARIGGTNIGHALLLQARRRRPGGIEGYEWLVNDPMKTAEQWIDQERVIVAMNDFAIRTGVPGDGLRWGLFTNKLPYIADGAA